MNPSLKKSWLSAAFVAAFALAGLAGAQSEQLIRFDGGAGDDRANAVVTDATGSIYVGGSSHSASSAVGFVVVKHNAAGVMQWVARYQGTAGQIDGTVTAVALDAAGNVYAAGYIAWMNGLQYNLDWLVVSFSPSGVQRWAHVFNSPGNGTEEATQVMVDASGAVYAAGFTGLGNDLDWLVVKYAGDGTILWQRGVAGAGAADDRPVAAALDGAGNLVVLGFTSNLGVTLAKDVTLVKYAPSGAVLWNNTFSDTADSDETPGGLALDATGAAYVTGITIATSNPELPNVPFLLKYDSGGNRQFFIRGDSAGGLSAALAPDGNIVVAGTSIGEGAVFVRPAVSKFTPAGVLVWTTPLASEGDVAVAGDGTVFVGGSRFRSTGFDYFATRLTAGGAVAWDFVEPTGGVAGASTLDASGAFLVTGVTDNTAALDMLTMRLPAGFVPGANGPALPAAPSSLGVAAAKGKLTLTWSDNSSNESGFLVERAVNGGAFAQVAQTAANVRTFADTGVSKGITYSYRVRAFSAGGNSAYSNTAGGQPK